VRHARIEGAKQKDAPVPLERSPHALLKSSAANVKRKIQADPWRVDEPNNPSHQGFVETVLSASRLIRLTSGKDSGTAFLAGGDQDGTQGRLTRT